MTDPDIEAACEDITKGLKTHRGCSPGSAAPMIKSLSGSTKDKRCLEVWFLGDVTAADRAWLLEAVNEKALRALAQRPLNTDAEPSRCKNTVARGESMETDALTGDAPVASVSTLSAQAKPKPQSLHGMIAEIYGELDAEDCAWIDREWIKWRGRGTITSSLSSTNHQDAAK